MKDLLILFGGKSGEYEVSEMSAASVLSNIDTDKYNIIKIGITKNGRWFKTDASPEQIKSGEWDSMPKQSAFLSPDTSHHGIFVEGKLQNVDVIFPVMHGDYCEDGCIQGLFELSGIPYVGPGVLASAAGMDKSATKLFAAASGVPQAKWYITSPAASEEEIEKIESKFSYPIFVKPCNAGSSLGISKAGNRAELEKAIAEAAKFDSKILCEEYIDGYEVECAVLGNEDTRASVVGQITPSNEFYDYSAKYIDNASGLTIPANIPEETAEKIREYAVTVFKALGCRGMSRVDFFVLRGSGEIKFNEINTLPGFTSISMYPKLWEKSGIPYSELIDKLIEYAEK